MGIKLYKENVFRNIASFREESQLKDGQIVNRPYRASVTAENITRGGTLTAQDLTATDDTLTVNKHKGLLMYVDEIDRIQNKWDAAKAWAEEAGERLANLIDAECLYEATSANETIDYNDLDSGQSAGVAAVVTSSNVFKLFTAGGRKLTSANVPLNGRFAVISPEVQQALLEYVGGKESAFGDRTSEAGNIGRFMGFDLFVSNNLTGSARWTPANQPSDGDTITIAGVVFAFETGSLDAAGKVKSETSTAVTLDNLVAFINEGGTGTAGTGFALSAANQRICQNLVAVDGATYVEVFHKGTANISVAGSDGTDTWTLKTQHLLFGQRGAIDLVIQKEPGVSMASTVAAGKLGMNILPYTLFGVKTFYDMKARVLDVEVDASAY
jgi:hypothetical protein